MTDQYIGGNAEYESQTENDAWCSTSQGHLLGTYPDFSVIGDNEAYWRVGYDRINYPAGSATKHLAEFGLKNHHRIKVDEDGIYGWDNSSGIWVDLLVGGGGGVTDHGELDGLGDDDHTQYHNVTRANTWLGTKSTTNLSEGTNLYHTTAKVEDIITAELVDGQSIDNAIDSLINTHNVANRHLDHTTISITAGTGLTGGGTIAANRTINCSITQYTDALAKAAAIQAGAYDQGTWNGNTMGATKDAIRDKIESMGGGATKGVHTLQMMPSISDLLTAEFITLDVIAEYFAVYFYIDPDVVSSNNDLVFTFIYRSNFADASVVIKKFIGANKTDGSEAYAWNIDNGGADTVVATINQRIYTKTVTVVAANISDNDVVMVRIYLNESGRSLNFMNSEVEYSLV